MLWRQSFTFDEGEWELGGIGFGIKEAFHTFSLVYDIVQVRGGSEGNAPGCLNNWWLDSMALPAADTCSNSKFRTYSWKKLTLDNMREHWRISNGPL